MSDPMLCRVIGTPCPPAQSCLCHPHPFKVQTCGRTMIGSGTDIYDPVCELPRDHWPDPCRSTAAVDQYRIRVAERVTTGGPDA